MLLNKMSLDKDVKILSLHSFTSTQMKEQLTQTSEFIWKDFIAGGEESYKELYLRYVDVLFQYGIQFSSDEELVKDAIQDVFVQIYNRRTHLKKEVNPKFYLFTCLKHRLYDVFKREVRFEPLAEDIISDKYFISDDTSDKRVEVLDEVKQTMGMLNKLTPKQREAVYYKYIQGLELKEIAEILKMNYQSVQNLLQRALKKLRDSAFFFGLW